MNAQANLSSFWIQNSLKNMNSKIWQITLLVNMEEIFWHIPIYPNDEEASSQIETDMGS